MFKFIKNLLLSSCKIFTVFVLLIASVVCLLELPEGFGIIPSYLLILFIFSLAISFANVLYFKTKFNVFVKYFVHLIITVVSSALLIGKVTGSFGRNIILLEIAIIVIHILVFLLIAFFKAKIQKEEEYKSIFDKNKKEKEEAEKPERDD